MSGISSTVRIVDGMSPALRNMNRALNIVLNSFESLQAASSNSIDTSAIQEARESLARASVAVNELENNLREAGEQQDRYTDRVGSSENAMTGLVNKAGKLLATYISLQTLAKAVGLSDQITQTQSRMALIVDVDENASKTEIESAVAGLEDKIMASANRSRAYYLDTAKSVASFAQRAGDAFSGTDEVIAFTENLNKMYAIAGATQQEQASSMLQLTQALGSGVLRGEEFNAVFEAAPNIMQEVAKYMDVPIGQLREMASEGQITAEVVKNAILSATDEINEDFESMDMTWQQVMTLAKNRGVEAFEPVHNKIKELANNQDVQNFIYSTVDSLAVLADIVVSTFELLTSMGSFIYDNWSVISPIIYGVAAALAIYYGYLLVTKTIELISSGVKIALAIASYAHAAATGAEASATAAATAAQYGLNTALLACPLTWIIIAIIAVIAAIYVCVAAINDITDSTYSATGIIAGVIAWLAALIWNIIVGVINAIIQFLWTSFVEPWIGIIEFILNVMNGGFDSFGDMVANLIGQIISWFLSLGKVVTKIIDAIFGTDWTSGLNSLQDSVLAWGKNENAITLDRNAPTVLNRVDMTNAYDTGYEFGKGVDDKASGLFNNVTNSESNSTDAYASNVPSYDELGGNVSDIANNTNSIADSVSTTEEDLKYLRDIAEQEAINRFTTAEIKIDMQNNNSINSNMDLDGVVSYLEDKLYESMNIAAEGVH